MEQGIKTSQRVSRSCVECGRRKIKCDKKSPCQPCIRRNAAHECRRPIARVRGQLTVYAAASTEGADRTDDLQIEELLRQRGALQAQVAELETALALSKPCAHSRASTSTDYSQPAASLEDLVPAFEQFDVGLKNDSATQSTSAKEITNRLYEPTTDPVSLLLPEKDASLSIVTFSLQTLGWLHCAVDSDVFLREHDEFWQNAQFSIPLERERRPWLTVYLALLAVGILYMRPEDMPNVVEMPQLCFPLDCSANVAVYTSRIWYEAALKEIERYACSGNPSLPVVQALSVLTLCHSNFGEHQREWLFTGFATNMARCLDMHKLGNEAAVSKEMCQRREWSTPSQREVGRRLWWSCVIRDWLGSWSRPPSISPASFCCQISTQSSLSGSEPRSAASSTGPSSPEAASLGTPSPAHYHSVMCRLAYIFYIYIKANTHQTPPKLTKAIEEIQNARKDLPLHLSQHFPVTDQDRQWEVLHPWVPFQRYLLTHVLDFLELGIARVLVSKETEDQSDQYRKLAVSSADRILRNYTIRVPRVYRLVWTVSAATVAASVYISLDMLANPHNYREDHKIETIDLLTHAAVELKKHADVAVHAAKGSAIIERLLPLVSQEQIMVSHPPRTVHDLVQQLSASDRNTELDYPALTPPDMSAAYIGTYEHDEIFGQFEGRFDETFGMNEWDEFLLGL